MPKLHRYVLHVKHITVILGLQWTAAAEQRSKWPITN